MEIFSFDYILVPFKNCEWTIFLLPPQTVQKIHVDIKKNSFSIFMFL